MMTVKISDLLNAVDTLQKLSQMKLKARLAFSIAKLIRAADAEVQEFNSTRMKIITEYGIKGENDELEVDEKGNCKVQEGKMNEFLTQLNELLSTEVELNASKLEINDINNLDFTPQEMLILEPFLEVEE